MSLKFKLRLVLICRYLSNSSQREVMVVSTVKLQLLEEFGGRGGGGAVIAQTRTQGVRKKGKGNTVSSAYCLQTCGRSGMKVLGSSDQCLISLEFLKFE